MNWTQLAKPPLHPREITVLRHHDDEGLSFTKIGKMYGLSPQTISHIYHVIQRKKRDYENREFDPFYGLTTRARCGLHNTNTTTREQLKAAIESGSVRRWRGIGKVTIEEYRKLLGMGPK